MGCNLAKNNATFPEIKVNNGNGAISRTKSAVSIMSTMTEIDRSKIKPPLNERDMITLLRTWEFVRKDIIKSGTLMFVT